MLLLGFAWLLCAVEWPQIRAWFFRVTGYKPKPKPAPLQDQLNEAFTLLHQAFAAQNEINDNFGERISELANDRTKAIGERSELSTRITNLDRRMDEMGSELAKHTSHADHVFARIPLTIEYLYYISSLRDEVESITSEYGRLRSDDPKSAVATKPFSGWRQANLHLTGDARDTDLEAAEKWARSLERHRDRLIFFGRRWKINLTSVQTSELFEHINSWIVIESGMKPERLMELMNGYYNFLGGLKDQASKLLDDSEVIAV